MKQPMVRSTRELGDYVKVGSWKNCWDVKVGSQKFAESDHFTRKKYGVAKGEKAFQGRLGSDRVDWDSFTPYTTSDHHAYAIACHRIAQIAKQNFDERGQHPVNLLQHAGGSVGITSSFGTTWSPKFSSSTILGSKQQQNQTYGVV